MATAPVSRPAVNSPTSRASPIKPARHSLTPRPVGWPVRRSTASSTTKSSSRTERYAECRLMADQIVSGPIDAARVGDTKSPAAAPTVSGRIRCETESSLVREACRDRASVARWVLWVLLPRCVISRSASLRPCI